MRRTLPLKDELVERIAERIGIGNVKLLTEILMADWGI